MGAISPHDKYELARGDAYILWYARDKSTSPRYRKLENISVFIRPSLAAISWCLAINAGLEIPTRYGLSPTCVAGYAGKIGRMLREFHHGINIRFGPFAVHNSLLMIGLPGRGLRRLKA